MGFFSRLGEMFNENMGKAQDLMHDAMHAAAAKTDAGLGRAHDVMHDAMHEGAAKLDTAIAERLTKGAQSFRENASIARGGETVHRVSLPVATPSSGKAPKLREI